MLLSVIFHPIFRGFYLLLLNFVLSYLFKLPNLYSFIYSFVYSFIYSFISYSFISPFELLSYPIYIRLFIRLFICLTFLSCSAIRYIHFLLLLFEQSSLIYVLFSFLFLFTVTKPFSSFKVFNPIQPNCCPRLQSGLLPLTLQDYVFCSKISWYKLLLDVIVVRL